MSIEHPAQVLANASMQFPELDATITQAGQIERLRFPNDGPMGLATENKRII